MGVLDPVLTGERLPCISRSGQTRTQHSVAATTYTSRPCIRGWIYLSVSGGSYLRLEAPVPPISQLMPVLESLANLLGYCFGICLCIPATAHIVRPVKFWSSRHFLRSMTRSNKSFPSRKSITIATWVQGLLNGPAMQLL